MRVSDIRGFLSEDILKRLRAAGFYNIGLGAESANQRILDKINKNIEVDDIKKIALMSYSTGIIFTFSFIVGFPNETIDEVLNTINFINEIREINSMLLIIGPQIFRPYPGSQLYKEDLKTGLEEPDSLRGWIGNRTISQFRRFDKSKLVWINDIDMFEKVMYTYNMQSYDAHLDGLQSEFYWGVVRKLIPNYIPEKLSPVVQKISDWIVTSVVIICRWRLKRRIMFLQFEFPIIRYLNNKYYHENAVSASIK